MNIFFWIICALHLLILLVELVEHGKEEVVKYNFYKRLTGSFVMITLILLAINN